MKFSVPLVLYFYLCRTVPPTPKYFHTFCFFFSFLHNFLCFLNSGPSCLWSLPICTSSSKWSLSLIQAPSSCSCFVIFFFFLFETDVKIRFRNLWNGFRHPFRYFFGFSMKRMSKSASENCETDFNIRFDIFFFWNGYRNSFQEFVKRISKSIWVFFFFKFWYIVFIATSFETGFLCRIRIIDSKKLRYWFRRIRIIDSKRLRYWYVSHLTISHVIRLEINIMNVLTSDSFVDILVISCFIKLLLLQEKKLA